MRTVLRLALAAALLFRLAPARAGSNAMGRPTIPVVPDAALPAAAPPAASAVAPGTEAVAQAASRLAAADRLAEGVEVLHNAHIDSPDPMRLYRRALRGMFEAAGEDLGPALPAFRDLQHVLLDKRLDWGLSWGTFSDEPDWISAVAPGSPAEAAGVRPCDRVLSVEGDSVRVKRRKTGQELEVLRAPMRFPPTDSRVRGKVVSWLAGLFERRGIGPLRADALVEAGLLRMFRSLDRHTHYFPREEAAERNDEDEGRRQGYGFGFSTEGGKAFFFAVTPGSPAQKAGLRAGDELLRVSGEDLPPGPLTEEDWPALARRLSGDDLRLTVRRGGRELELPTMSRAEFATPTVASTLLPGGRGYVRLSRFSKPSGEELIAAVSRLRAQGAASLLIDLRSNPGGEAASARMISEAFLPAGRAIWRTATRAYGNQVQFRSTVYAVKAGPFADLPLVVLVDRKSASASEVLAAALQENGRARVVGEPTLGKGSGQSVHALSGGALAFVTHFRWFTPSGRNVGDDAPKGVRPDLHIPNDEEGLKRVERALQAFESGEPLEPAADPALAAALGLLP